MTTDRDTPGADPAMAKALLALSALLLFLCIALAGGWYLAWKRGSTLDIANLSPDEAQTLVEQYAARSASGLRYAFFEPRLGYTLLPRSELSVWGDTFRSNALGYRTGPLEKDEGTFRVLFVGDSWTYGMGVREEDAFPYRFGELARDHAGTGRRIEAWNLALPGYNAVNQLAALDGFFDLIRPDAVVLCPTTNDIDGTKKVTRSGSLRMPRRSEWGELFLDWRSRYLDSHLNRVQWERAFDAYRETAARLEAKSIPFFLFFSADWHHEAVVHDLVARAGVAAPYAVVPVEYLGGRWRSESRWGHGTPEAYTVFARIVYGMMAPELGWAALPETAGPGREVGYHRTPPAGDWKAESDAVLRDRVVPFEDFVPGTEARVPQIVSGVDWRSGAVSSNAAVLLLRRGDGRTRLRLELSPLPDTLLLHPLEVSVSIPSPSGGTRATGTITADAGITAVEIAIPADIETGSGIDLVIEAPRAVLDRQFVARSFLLVRVDPL